MKKTFYSLMFMALAAMTFTGCEDVPAPFDIPTQSNNQASEPAEPMGSGTVADPYNVAAAIAVAQQLETGQESASDIFIKGKVVSIRENYTTQYGNAAFYISDDGTAKNQFLVYRALYLGNKKYTSGDLLNEGDEVIICGKVTNYNGTLETVQNKAFLYSLNGKTDGGEPTPAGDAKGSGTLEDPFNPVAANAYTSKLPADTESDGDIYIKGKISKIADNGEFSAQYGNATFYISEDGSAGNDFYVYRTLYLGNKKWANGDTQIKVGDEVIICGKVVNFRGNTAETVASKSYIYSLNGKSEGGDTPQPQPGTATGSGTQADPWNSVAANDFVSKLAADTPTDQVYYIKGKVESIANNGSFNAQYGNASFYISDDGKSDNRFYVFRTLYLDNRKWVDGDKQIQVGDDVVICGKLVNYRGNTPETVQNESYIFSLNSSGGGGGEEGGGSTQTGDVTKTVSGSTITLVVNNTTEGSTTVTADLNEQGWENSTEPTTITLADGTTIAFETGEGSSAPKFYTATKGVRVYAKNTIIIKGSSPVAKVVLQCDSYQGTDYIGNEMLTGTVSGNTLTIINDHSEAKGGVQLRVQTITITYAK